MSCEEKREHKPTLSTLCKPFFSTHYLNSPPKGLNYYITPSAFLGMVWYVINVEIGSASLKFT